MTADQVRATMERMIRSLWNEIINVELGDFGDDICGSNAPLRF